MDSDWRRDETREATVLKGGAARELVPGLTLLAHPDAGRIGERLALPVLAMGREVALSRLTPVFRAPGGHRSTARRTLQPKVNLEREPHAAVAVRGVRSSLRACKSAHGDPN